MGVKETPALGVKEPRAFLGAPRTLPKGRAAGALGMQKQPPDSVASLMGRAATMQRTVPPCGGFGKGWGKWAGVS